jgi:hypothetical protein
MPTALSSNWSCQTVFKTTVDNNQSSENILFVSVFLGLFYFILRADESTQLTSKALSSFARNAFRMPWLYQFFLAF